MSGLAGLLAGRTAPGVYLWHTAFAPEEVRHTVEHADRRFGYVDGWTHQTKAELLEAIGEALDFPEHYGRNLDALADCLSEVDDDVVLLWDGWGPIAREDPDLFEHVLRILRKRERLTVLLRGAGPEIDVPSLD
jgi:RNAse (barnase) inhibitor barstar